MQRIYLDYNATAPLRPEAREAMEPWLDGAWGNPSSVHAEGREARNALERARESVASLIGAAPRELVLTGSATEANNTALKGLALGARGRERGGIRPSAVEHPSVLGPAEWLGEALPGFDTRRLPVDGQGRLHPERIGDHLDGGTLVVSVVAANNETGVLQPVAELAERVHAVGALLHVDATQALGRVPVDVEAWGADLLTASSHKLGGPRGAGALWIRSGVPVAPLLHGGHQERRQRAGTEDVASAVGFGAACEVLARHGEAERARIRRLRDRLWAGIARRFPEARWLGGGAPDVPNTLHVAFPGADGEALLMSLDLAGLAASSGSACSAGSLEPSHVLEAMDVEEPVSRSAVRFSLGWASTEADVDETLDVLPDLVERTRAFAEEDVPEEEVAP